jgi:uncharacterized cupredoxin-like copper-binding protein
MPSVADPPARRSRLRRVAGLFLLAGLATLIASSAWGAGLPAAGPRAAGARALGATGGPGGPGSGTSGQENITVNLTDAPSFDPRNLMAVAGDEVTFLLNNTGTFNHSFTISAAAGVILAQNTTPAALDEFLTSNGTLVNVTLPGNSTRVVNYTVPGTDAGDSFELVSQVPYQFQAGMFGFFNVTSGKAGPAVQLNDTTVDSLAFVPDILNASSITTFPAAIDVLVTNEGGDSHTFTVEAQSNNTLDPATFTNYFASHPPAVNVVVPSGTGSTVWANFTVPLPGAYEYICEVSGHFVNGMYGWIYIGEPVPTVAAGPSSALVQPALLAGAGVLLAIGLLLALAAMFTGRFPKKPPTSDGH